MATKNEGGLSPDYLKKHCPIAWNTPERQDTYAKLGFDMVGEAWRLIKDQLGSRGEVAPGELPVRLDMCFSARRPEDERQGPVVRVAKRQDAEAKPLSGAAPCAPSDDKWPLSSAYLDDHEPAPWNDPHATAAYATLGYAIERAVIFGLIEEPAHGDEAERVVPVTVDTTKKAGGCAVCCVNGTCTHMNRR